MSSIVTGPDGPHEEFDPWLAVVERIADGAILAGLDDGLTHLITAPERILEVSVPVRMDDGQNWIFEFDPVTLDRIMAYFEIHEN